MSARVEVLASAAIVAVLSAMLVVEGNRRVELERQVPVEPKELYRTLARSQTSWQVVDVRPDLAEGYEEAHVPGAIPLPGCDPAQAPGGRACPDPLLGPHRDRAGSRTTRRRCGPACPGSPPRAGWPGAWTRGPAPICPEDIGSVHAALGQGRRRLPLATGEPP